MYLEKLYAVFKKGGDMIFVQDRAFIALHDYVAHKMIEETIEQGTFPKLTIEEIEVKPVYIVRKGEKD